jgi:thiaminase (transcriptional activator TenA)
MWGYSELAQRLVRHPPSGTGPYAAWIDMYAGEEFAELARWCREICDEAGAGATPPAKARMRGAFLVSSRHELAFWESAWRSSPDSWGANAK